MPENDDMEFEYKEFEEVGTYHRTVDIPSDWSELDIMNFILENGLKDETYLIQYKYNIEGEEKDLHGSSWQYDIDDAGNWIDDVGEDLDNYGVDSVGGYSVVFIGSL